MQEDLQASTNLNQTKTTSKKTRKSKPAKDKFKKQGCLTPQSAETPIRWRKPAKNLPVVGVRDEFVMKVAQDFAVGKIDYDELKFRLRFRKPSRGRNACIVAKSPSMLQTVTTY